MEKSQQNVFYIYVVQKSSQFITYKMFAYSQIHSFQSVKKVNRNDERVEKIEKKRTKHVIFSIYDVIEF